ncbi:pyridoxamine 5'-phosphate oxidase [Actinokineospora iranica]|uniref:Uncharacterized protein n=1 Tax=Actinokineospora iranica TaxID=1271860 RepID=A0A1G6Z240_9PSEU|nr:pyridoxamine 5'-phosphate oxidase [Actinokineospora iranica]SDD96804.1 hypothetical protein SAMN05216174_12521 [Actinokineospora iranica]
MTGPAPRWVRVVAALAGSAYLVQGVWAVAHPRSFADLVATFPPYNAHYLHDNGAFAAGVGVCVLTALVWADALGAALAGAAAASVLHLVNHITDAHLGGSPSDLVGLGAMAALTTAALIAAALTRRARGRGAAPGRTPAPASRSRAG